MALKNASGFLKIHSYESIFRWMCHTPSHLEPRDGVPWSRQNNDDDSPVEESNVSWDD